ncbi:hypothetical protein Pcinc_016304 [Petrolisthes cinctipes]|uniref:Uncharacterized protein n=1 Tax=Petrolisthes cinctipes TaxID=88211 RepID=A0AAE1FRC9_PETCI|nr:hypothetical protein Pcinc_016304 [Petrolisthes cinctipes]
MECEEKMSRIILCNTLIKNHAHCSTRKSGIFYLFSTHCPLILHLDTHHHHYHCLIQAYSEDLEIYSFHHLVYRYVGLDYCNTRTGGV